MNFITKWLIEKEGEHMLTKLWTALDGYKTYIVAGLGIVVALLGHAFGPFSIGTLQVPQFSWGEVWQIVWNGGLFAALRHGTNS